jgi:hypothetical protein
MADSGFRSSRRDARDADAPRDSVADPLAELARLIGQNDAHGGRDSGQTADGYDEARPASDFDWAADENYAQQHGHDDERGYAPGLAEPTPSYQPDTASWPRGHGYEQDPAPAHPQARPAPAFEAPRAQAPRSQPLSYIPPAHEGYQTDGQTRHGAPAPAYARDYAGDEYEDDAAPPRRSGTVAIVALLGLAVIGTAGALGYRAMFGSPIVPLLPPVITPGNTPVKIVPNQGGQASAPNQADTSNGGNGAQLAPREEQPIEVQPPNQVPRVVTTIPVISNAPETTLPGGPTPGGSNQAPGVQSTPPPAFAQANGPGQPFGSPDQSPPPSAVAPPSGAKAVHTVTIRPGQQGNMVQANADVPPGAVHSTKPQQTMAKQPRETAPRPGSGGPLSILPGQQGEAAPPPPTRTAMAHSPSPMPTRSEPAEAVPASGGSFVQVTSQRSEAEAQAAFQTLQARYPQQLGGRHPVIRRADLGAKGVYYRAMVGPFASAEQAGSLCTSLKAAGGNCLVQRN